ncbi:hypothetical protein F6X40_01910 [Paraburkholderia sp. UCT31]|uniref:hypothetical protein n=1 Tax=Paraburkholderia sp. UCT31 TaxID=2615209 RepID=UPI0016565E47|nr:hypothetical protein [Paraburkholderia sp. UCT31]MBC8735620.1 hypothetical protein [Paraburkholderia sp. UCT31]
MSIVKKLTLGFRPGNRAFRVESMRGLLIDTLMDARGSALPETFYTLIADPSPAGVVSLMDQEQGNILYVDRDNVVITRDVYKKQNGNIDLEAAFGDFKRVWGVIQGVLKLDNIRRIGIVAEHRYKASGDGSSDLISKITRLPVHDYPANFTLQFESRTHSGKGKLDAAKGAFTNCIYQIYDSAIDATAPAEGFINSNFDYQTYYSPLINTKNVTEEMERHFFAFKRELVKFNSEMDGLGLKGNGAKQK